MPSRIHDFLQVQTLATYSASTTDAVRSFRLSRLRPHSCNGTQRVLHTISTFTTGFHIRSRHFEAWPKFLHVCAYLNCTNRYQYSHWIMVGPVRLNI